MIHPLLEYYRCPEELVRLAIQPKLSQEPGFFRFGSETTCYGRVSGAIPAARVTDDLIDVSPAAVVTREGLCLPFDITEVVNNLRLEGYRQSGNGRTSIVKEAFQSVYYVLRPFWPSVIRTNIQRMYYSRWQRIPFPLWPVDFSADRVLQNVLTLVLRNKPAGGIPFIWFWPHGLPSCAVMTHDVEAVKGRDFCTRLMDLDDSFNIKSAFEIVPERRYEVSETFLDSIRSRGFEINVHDLNHDGFLYRDRQTFVRRAQRINQYIRRYGASGFRSGAMYRKPAWYDALNVSYDMSIPNVAHMEPQRGGCCTVMPYFIGNILELPLTATQDFALINVLRAHTCELWKREIAIISAEQGLISFIVHPDYMVSSTAQEVYTELLAHLSTLRSEGKLWIALPGEVNDWWRQRAQMRLVRCGDGWTIEGPGKDRARIAYARLVDGRLTYVLGADSDARCPH